MLPPLGVGGNLRWPMSRFFHGLGGEACDVAIGDDTTARGWGGGGDDGRRGGVRIMKGLTKVD
jgi:hypothetical protein